MERKNGYIVVTLTELKKNLDVDWINQNIPVEITYNGESIAKLVPKTWKDPRFLAMLHER
jgi:antitoxin (DNA-binding transcriptional repressor) of toxin-antitoxin stability system